MNPADISRDMAREEMGWALEECLWTLDPIVQFDFRLALDEVQGFRDLAFKAVGDMAMILAAAASVESDEEYMEIARFALAQSVADNALCRQARMALLVRHSSVNLDELAGGGRGMERCEARLKAFTAAFIALSPD